MARIFVIADTHFGHSNIIKFTNDQGEIIRKDLNGNAFNNVHEHDELIIRFWNETVLPEDHVYHLGDVVINRKHLWLCTRLMGHKRLVRGNHDIFKTKEYIENGFDEIYGCRVFPKHGLILSHIPIHPDSLKKDWVNVHGHTHSNIVRLPNGQPDKRYRCVSVDHTSYKPVLLLETKEKE